MEENASTKNAGGIGASLSEMADKVEIDALDGC